MKIKKIHIIISFISVIIIGLIFAFYMTNNTQSLDEVSVKLKWTHQAQFAGMYVADQKGYYEENGISITLDSFDFRDFPVDDVVSGKVTFGVAGADEVMIARSQGKKIKAIAVIYQESPVIAYSLKESGIVTPEDIVGKRLGVQEGNPETTVKEILVSQGIDYDNEIIRIPIGFDIGPLINNEVDVATGYIINEPIQAEEQGYEINIISPATYGVNVYSDVLFATEDMINNNPDLVRNFVEATLKGWSYALDNVDESVRYTLLYDDPNNDAQTFSHQKSMLEKSILLVKPNNNIKIGQIDSEKWEETFELLYKNGIIDSQFDASVAYTTEFLE